MDGAWLVVKWVSVTVLVIYFAVQVLALQRLDGDYQRRARWVMAVMTVLVLFQSWVWDIFVNRAATRILMLVVGVIAIGSTVLLARMVRSHKLALKDGVGH